MLLTINVWLVGVSPIHTVLEKDGGITTNNVAASDSTTLTQRSFAAGSTLTQKRQMVGLLEVLTNNTEVSIEFSQATTTPAVASTTRKRSYIIARKIA